MTRKPAFRSRTITLLLCFGFATPLALAACGKKDGDQGSSAKGERGMKHGRGGDDKSVPKETAPLALDQGKGKIPATIDVPKGCTIFADEPTTLRVSYKRGRAFGVQVAKGNEYNTNFKDTAKELAQNKYGVKNQVIEQTDTLLRYVQTSDGFTTHRFSLLVTLNGTKWVCREGNHGGWTAEQAAAQLAACKTLKAK